MKKFFLALSFLMVLSLVLAACGGGASTSNSVKVTMTDFAFNPNTINVPAGKEVDITLTNNGTVDHDFTVMSKPVSGTFSDADKANVIWQKTVAAGKTETDKFTAPAQAGEYQIVCAVPGHVEAGMVAKLVVQ